MVSNLPRKIFGIVALAILSVWSLATFNLEYGLDLQGGSRIVYGFDWDEAVRLGTLTQQEVQDNKPEILEQVATIIERRIGPLVEAAIYPQGEESLVVELPGMSEEQVEDFKRTLIQQGTLQFKILVDPQKDADLQPTAEVEKIQQWFEEHREEYTREDGSFDLKRFVQDYDLLPEDQGGPRKGIRWVRLSENALTEGVPTPPRGLDPLLTVVMVRDEDALRGHDKEADPDGSWDFSGEDLAYVGPGNDQYGNLAVRFEFKSHRATAFTAFTEEHTKRNMAIILEGELYNAPTINETLPGGGIITGGLDGFTREEMDELVTVLRSGAMPVRPYIANESFVGPTLGADSIRRGVQSALIGGGLVLIFMVAYYWLNGVVASLALLYNGLLLVGALSFTQATLTLPGLAGLVLTIGMAVDANILIFERVREERRRGREVPQAYKNGFERAFTTIVDANLTTLITALILLNFGTGPVRGFAAVLALGILTSMFSALVFSKVIFHWLVFRARKIREVRMVRALAAGARIPFLRVRRVAYAVSAVLLVGGLVYFAKVADEILGIEFIGGGSATIQLQEPMTRAELAGILEQRTGANYQITVSAGSTSQAGALESTTFVLRRKITDEERATGGETFFENEVRTALQGYLDPDKPFLELSTVGERVSDEIQDSALLAIFFSLLAIVIYMNFRFKEYRYGLAAVAALVHDTLITLGMIAVFTAGLGWVDMEINLSTIAAFLTIIGYSLNDTIVVFDRIRENLPRTKGRFVDIIDMSINQSLSRTILTSLTTFIVVLILFLANKPFHNVLEGFSFAMLVGVVVGTYSSVFVASPLLLALHRRARSRREAAEAQAAQAARKSA